MDTVKKPRIAQFTKTLLDLGLYMTLTVVVLWAGILMVAAIKKLPMVLNGIYIFSGLRVGLTLDKTLYSITIPELGIENVQMMGASFSLFLMEGSGVFIWLGVAATVIKVIVVLILLYNLRHFVKSVIDRNPFVQINRIRLRRIGFGLIAGYCALLLIVFMHEQLVVSLIQAELIEISAGQSTTASNWMLITGLLSLVVADAFRHGSDLQLEQDLTV